MKIKLLILSFFVLISGMIPNSNVYASNGVSEYADAIRAIGSLSDDLTPGISDIMDLPDGCVLNLAADILDEENPEDALKNFVKDLTISEIEEKISIAGIVINSLTDGALFQIEVCDSNDEPVNNQSVYEYFNMPSAKNFEIKLTEEEFENLDHINIRRYSNINTVNISSLKSWKRSDGKTDVIADVIAIESKSGGFLAIGYDANNKAIETKCIHDYLPSGKVERLVLTLDSKNIDHVEVKPIGNANDIKLLSAADRVEDGQVIVTGVVENGGEATEWVGMLAIGYDENDKAVETKVVDSNMFDGSAKYFTIEFDASEIIRRVEVKPTGNANDIKLLSAADRVEDGQVIVTGAIENGRKTRQWAGILAIGYDKNDKAVETKAIDTFVDSGSTEYFTIELDASEIIRRVEVQPTGTQTEIKLLSSADRVENGQVIVTGVVENGSNEPSNTGIVIIGYDKNNTKIETKSFTGYAGAGKILNCEAILDSGSAINYLEIKVQGDTTSLPSMIGDVNTDGEINSTDMTVLKRHLLKKTTLAGENLVNADTNGDGDVNSTDLTLLKRYILRKITSFPV
jgi:hypothetical protein